MIDIAFVNETNEELESWEPLLTRVIEMTLQVEGISDYKEVSVIFVTTNRIKQINRDYRGKDQVTDVISFALSDDEDTFTGIDIPVLGDIFICVDQARKQAKEYGHSIEREMGFLVCHGLLHLLGYDHQTKEEETEMFGKQEKILEQLNLTRKGVIHDE